MNAVKAHRKPLAVEAVQWAGSITSLDVSMWAGPRVTGQPWVRMNLQGALVTWDDNADVWLILPVGWWLVKDSDGNIERVPPARFEAEYEVDE